MAKKRVAGTQLLIVGLSIGVFLIVGGLIAAFTVNPNPAQPSQDTSSTQASTNLGNATAPDTERLLVYLIEEEKLAHDVYTKLGEIWGAKVFSNIAQSETTHQQEVLKLLNARNIADPRSESLGVFQNSELQTFYDQLIAQGSQSLTQAYKVGVIIEEKDIADISSQLKNANDSDVIATLKKLRRASENHLRAFNRQL